MKVEKRLELALRISESIENGKICPNNLYDLQLHLSDALEQVKKLTIPVVSCSTYKIAISDRSCTYDYEIELPNTTCIRDIAKRLYSSFGLKEEEGILRN